MLSRRWPTTIWVLLLGSVLARAGGFAYPFLSYRVTDAGFTTAAAGQTLAAFGAGWLVGQPSAGWLADRVGRRRTLVGVMSTAAATMVALAEAESYAALLAAAFLTGAVYDAHRPVTTAAITDLVPGETARAAVNGARHFGINVAAAITGAVGGLVASSTGTTTLFYVNAAVCLAFAVLAWALVTDNPSPAGGGPSRSHLPSALADLRLWLLAAATLSALLGAAGVFATLPLLMAQDGLTAAAYGWTQVANGAAVLLLSPIVTPWLSRRAASVNSLLAVFAASSLLLGSGMTVAGLSSTLGSYCLAATLIVPGEIAIFIAAGALLDHIAPVGARGLYAGIWGTTLAGAIILSPLVSTWSLAHGGGQTVAVVSAAAGGLGAALALPLAAVLYRPAARPHAGFRPDLTTV
ncbi:MFS transporter [Streptomyces sp. NPDC058548]|uniref:MFS transporter n=1 Tax=Streptomyces sp. NPDC058548 TaxID=3346545 RepID=UPI0036612DEE